MLGQAQFNIPYSYAKRHGVLIAFDGDTPILYKKETTPIPALVEVQRQIGERVTHTVVDDDAFNKLLTQLYTRDQGESQQIAAGLEDHPDLMSLADQVPESEDLMDQEDDAPIIRLINALLSEAIRLNASDIHIEPFEKKLSVRYRVDGQLREVVEPRKATAPLLISRIKVMAKLDIAEKRIPQDGRISLKLAGREVDVRVSTLPSSFGERVVMRLLDKQAGRLNVSHLGLLDDDLHHLKELILRPHGIILVTGPTGSGKTTSLYAVLSELNDKTRNILTAEDPIEYQLEGIGQTQVNPKVDMTFARCLRAMLRQDPDVVMVGEIRDLETAEIAVQASLTGHLVLSTLHTNTALGAVTRLRDMGIEPFLISNALIGVVAQRLVRTLCKHCVSTHAADDYERHFFAELHSSGYYPTTVSPFNSSQPLLLPKAVGCEVCNYQGYTGRSAIYEIVPVTEEIRRLVHLGAAEHELVHVARQFTKSIQQDGLIKVLQHKTTLEEVLRATLDR